jgi:uncharacterized protein involved in exopolysaccharide biosynthesis
MLSEKEQKSDVGRFWNFIRQYTKTLVIYAALGGLMAFVVTFFIPKQYKASGIVYPPSSTSIDNSIDYPNFGHDVEADRLIQILGSIDIRDSVINTFRLDEEFKVDKDAPDWLDNLSRKYYKAIRFERMPSMSILISASTKDPKLSANIVNYIIHLADALRERIYKKNIVSAYEHAKTDYDTQKRLVDSLQTALAEKLKQNNLSSLLILMSDAQISFDLDKLNALGSTASNSSIGPDIIAFKSMYEVFKEYKARFIKVRKTYNNPIPKLYVINYSEPVYKKTSPSFTINTAVGMLFALVIAIMVLLIKHSREVK